MCICNAMFHESLSTSILIIYAPNELHCDFFFENDYDSWCFRVCSVVELDGTECDGFISGRRSHVRLRDMMEWPRSPKGNIQYRCGTHPSGQIGRTRWNATVSPSNLIKFSYN
jgi:hypothetical protein